ncbi:presqualene diphosphate synthase HpnD [Actinomadura rayongensis]|uniref:Presqualene diphosphate synthase HpnD n=1 Tax=Actinomadura rayongensis TaxID=1429076 RepID=A0A6I4WDZ9_9ACTN|nr:presqualene diphosphate synthase HpnD [Actinomadura rayongensis]MXQ67921.1 presqualene diphosphate synthase HpnD [Actinomadura rayongensis]
MTVADAYQHCERVVREEARNFAYGIRLMPAPKRRAMSAIYAFARRVDDIGDGPEPAEARLDMLADARRRLDTLQDVVAGRAGIGALGADPVLTALADAAMHHPIPLDAFGELIDGCESDVRGAHYEAFEDLLAYCRQVAGTIGRLSLGVFGTERHAEAGRLADALGVALQLTNILRDVREDRLAGRIYLPAETLDRFGCTLDQDADGRFTDPPEKLHALVRFEVDRARAWYLDGLRLLPLLDRRSAACTAAMSGIYRRLLDRISEHPTIALSSRMSLPTWQKAVVAARALSGVER